MCGIVGYVGRQNAVPVLLEGLARLEYRGYDSAGVAVARNDSLRVHKQAGKVRDLAASMPKRITGNVGIAHTRWATHGLPTDSNAHPHIDMPGRIAVVHNGMIEDAGLLRGRLEADGIRFTSETDTEVLAHLIALEDVDDLEEAVRRALRKVHGAYGLAVLDARQPDRIVLARNGSPVLIGVGDRQMLCASDMAALVRHAQQVVHLEDGELATVTADSFSTTTLDAQPSVKTATRIDVEAQDYERGEYEHFMLKEIFEQPDAIEATLRGRLDTRFSTARLGGLNFSARELRAFRRVHIIAAGSALYAGVVGAGMLESLARLPASAEPAAEFRYRNPVIEPDTLYVAVSQSGETADTLAAVEEVVRKGGRVLGIVNVPGSSISRAVDGGIYIHAGPEQSVASTKAFTCMAVAFALLALHLGRLRDLGPADGQRLITALAELPARASEAIAETQHISRLAQWLSAAQAPPSSAACAATRWRSREPRSSRRSPTSTPRPTRRPSSSTAARFGRAGAPDDRDCPTTAAGEGLASLEQVHSRRGPAIAVSHRNLGELADHQLIVPKSEPELDPILLGLPLQAGLLHGGRPRKGHRSAAQPRRERHGE